MFSLKFSYGMCVYLDSNEKFEDLAFKCCIFFREVPCEIFAKMTIWPIQNFLFLIKYAKKNMCR